MLRHNSFWKPGLLAISIAFAFLIEPGMAQGMYRGYGMCPMWGMAGSGMILGLVTWLLFVALMVTALIWLIKQIRKA